ncbi:MAG TPA: SRPBCC family protein [Natronosporangium sp.]|nr:SRPBCC family protein [Natronosporangium sp.]
MTTITESVEVAVPVRTAYNQWTQFEEFPRFMGGVAEVRQLSDTRTHWVTTVGGVTREFDAEITEQVPDRRVAWESISGARQAGTVDIEPVAADRSRVTVRMEYEPQRFTEKVADAMGLLRRQVRRDLDRFRDFIEERGTETGGWRGEVRGDEPPDDARTW